MAVGVEINKLDVCLLPDLPGWLRRSFNVQNVVGLGQLRVHSLEISLALQQVYHQPTRVSVYWTAACVPLGRL